VAQWMAVTDDG